LYLIEDWQLTEINILPKIVARGMGVGGLQIANVTQKAYIINELARMFST